jgi:hypothetical protein
MSRKRANVNTFYGGDMIQRAVHQSLVEVDITDGSD